MKRIISLTLILLTWSVSYGQLKMPAASPTFTLKGMVGLADVEVVYSRPSVKGRTVFGELVPYGEVWRTGANASTKLNFSQDVMIEGKMLKAGNYALYSIPGKKEWTMIISNNTELWGKNGYNDADDALRFTVPTKSVSSHYESFTISFSDFTMNSAVLNLKWEKTKAQFKIENDVDSQVMAQIKDMVIEATPENAGTYYQAASYYYEAKVDDKMALSWVNKAIDGGQERYWIYHLKAKLAVRLGQNKEAEMAAMKSKELATEAGNMDYVRLNDKLVASLKDMD